MYGEGKVTEVLYFDGIRIARRIKNERVVIYRDAGKPKQIVDRAVALKRKNEVYNKSQGIRVTDTVWAVFDRDEHSLIPEAKQMAKRNGIGIAFSNPNFELFLLLHFEQLNREEHRDIVAKLLRKHIPNYKKAFDYEATNMHGLYPEAKKRLEEINGRSTESGGIETPPYCCVHDLVDHLRAF